MSLSITRNTRALARRLLDREAGSGCDAIIQVSDKLRINLGSMVGVVGFRALLHRALILSNADIGTLENITVHLDGKLAGLDEFAARSTQKQIDDAGEAIISRLLVLVEIFLGEALTRSLLHHIWPMPPIKTTTQIDQKP